MAFVSFFWAGKKPKDPADKNLKSAIPAWRMSFSEPPFHRLPCHGASQQHHTEEPLALPFFPSKVNYPCCVPGAPLLSSPYPPLTAQSFRAELWGRLMPQHCSRAKIPSVGSRSHCKAQWASSCPAQPSLYLRQSILYSEGSSWRGCVSLDTVQSAKGPWVQYTCGAVILTHYCITEFAPKFLSWKGHKTCWFTEGNTQKNKCCEQT